MIFRFISLNMCFDSNNFSQYKTARFIGVNIETVMVRSILCVLIFSKWTQSEGCSRFTVQSPLGSNSGLWRKYKYLIGCVLGKIITTTLKYRSEETVLKVFWSELSIAFLMRMISPEKIQVLWTWIIERELSDCFCQLKVDQLDKVKTELELINHVINATCQLSSETPCVMRTLWLLSPCWYCGANHAVHKG